MFTRTRRSVPGMVPYTARVIGLLLLLWMPALGQFQSAPPGSARASFGRFIIGVDAVGPSTVFPVPNTPENGGTFLHWVTGAQLQPGVCEEDEIPIERWEQLQDLGVDMGCVWLSHAALLGDGTREIRQAAADHGLLLGLVDMGVMDGATNYSGMERLIYQVESPLMVDTTGLLCIDDDALHLRGYDGSVYPQTPWNNAVLFPCDGVPVGVLLDRRPAPTGRPATYQGRLWRDGVYYLSLRLHYDTIATAAEHAIPNDTTTIFQVTIVDEDDSTNNSFALRGEAFYEGGGAIDSVREFLLDIIRVEYDASADRITVVSGLISDPDTHVSGSGYNTGGTIVPEWGTTRMPFRIEYMPFDQRRPVVALDAMLLSCGKAFALFNPTHPSLPRTWHPTPREFLDRMIEKLCGEDGTPPASMIMFQESGANRGNAPVAGFVSDRIREISNGKTHPFLYAPSGMGQITMPLFTEAFAQCLQSFYFYPYALNTADGSARAPVPGSVDYYPFHFQQDGWYPRLDRMTEEFRAYAEYRKTTRAGDWIPVMQNHPYGARDGSPTGVSASDLYWLREPTTAELRCSVNLALAYGAKGIFYWLFNGTPGYDTTDAELCGVQGFLTFDHCKKARNAYGENYWDSVRAFHNTRLRILGDTLFPLEWERGYSLERWRNGMLPTGIVSRVRSSSGEGYDLWEHSYVEVAEFHTPLGGDSVRYVLLLNKRTDDAGSRRIAIALRDDGGSIISWKVRDVLRNQQYTAPACSDFEALAGTQSIAVDVAPGAAVLLRVSTAERKPPPQPTTFTVGAHFPQPVRTQTHFPVSMPMAGDVYLELYDSIGRLLLYQRHEITAHEGVITLDASTLTSGIYVAVFRAGGQVRTRSVCILR